MRRLICSLVLVSLIGLSLVSCGRAEPTAIEEPVEKAGMVTIEATMLATQPPPLPTHTPSLTQAPYPTDTPSPPSTPFATQLVDGIRDGYVTLFLLEASVVMLEEMADEIDSGNMDEWEGFGGLLVIAAMVSAADEALSEPAPADVLQQAWKEAQIAVPLLQDVMKRWVDKEITSEDISGELRPVRSQIDRALQAAEATVADQFGIAPSLLRQWREEAIAELRTALTTTQTPAASLTPRASTVTPVVKDTPTPASKAPERILFVGNSLTFINRGVETHLKTMAASGDPPLTIETSSATAPGATLKDHYTGVSFALDEIRGGDWDVVVLQGSRDAVDSEEEFEEYATKLDEEISKIGAQTVFFMIWGTKEDPNQQALLSITTESQVRAYEKIGTELGAKVAPVGLAWEHSINENPDLNLYYWDSRTETQDPIHPSIQGTYLTVCVFYATLFGESPVGLSYAPEEISEEEIAFLQRIAWETVEEYEQPAAD